MAKLVAFTVAREHQGDRITDEGTEVHRFLPGETRVANPSVVAELVKAGVLTRDEDTEEDEAEKAEAPVENKSEGNAPENKAEPAAGTATTAVQTARARPIAANKRGQAKGKKPATGA